KMINEEMQRAMEFIVNRQAQFAANQQKADERLTRLEDIVGKLAAATLNRFESMEARLVEMSENVDRKIAALVDAQMRTEENVKMPDMNGIEMLRRVREFLPDAGVVMMTAFATVETAREAFKLGADDFIQKPFDVDELKLIAEKALERLRLLQENRAFRRAQRERGRLDQIIGHSQKMQAVYQMIETVAQVQ